MKREPWLLEIVCRIVLLPILIAISIFIGVGILFAMVYSIVSNFGAYLVHLFVVVFLWLVGIWFLCSTFGSKRANKIMGYDFFVVKKGDLK